MDTNTSSRIDATDDEKLKRSYCPYCQFPFKSQRISSPSKHISKCKKNKIVPKRECSDGVSCVSAMETHYKLYSHKELAERRKNLNDIAESLTTKIAEPFVKIELDSLENRQTTQLSSAFIDLTDSQTSSEEFRCSKSISQSSDKRSSQRLSQVTITGSSIKTEPSLKVPQKRKLQCRRENELTQAKRPKPFLQISSSQKRVPIRKTKYTPNKGTPNKTANDFVKEHKPITENPWTITASQIKKTRTPLKKIQFGNKFLPTEGDIIDLTKEADTDDSGSPEGSQSDLSLFSSQPENPTVPETSSISPNENTREIKPKAQRMLFLSQEKDSMSDEIRENRNSATTSQKTQIPKLKKYPVVRIQRVDLSSSRIQLPNSTPLSGFHGNSERSSSGLVKKNPSCRSSECASILHGTDADKHTLVTQNDNNKLINPHPDVNDKLVEKLTSLSKTSSRRKQIPRKRTKPNSSFPIVDFSNLTQPLSETNSPASKAGSESIKQPATKLPKQVEPTSQAPLKPPSDVLKFSEPKENSGLIEDGKCPAKLLGHDRIRSAAVNTEFSDLRSKPFVKTSTELPVNQIKCPESRIKAAAAPQHQKHAIRTGTQIEVKVDQEGFKNANFQRKVEPKLNTATGKQSQVCCEPPESPNPNLQSTQIPIVEPSSLGTCSTMETEDSEDWVAQPPRGPGFAPVSPIRPGSSDEDFFTAASDFEEAADGLLDSSFNSNDSFLQTSKKTSPKDDNFEVPNNDIEEIASKTLLEANNNESHGAISNSNFDHVESVSKRAQDAGHSNNGGVISIGTKGASKIQGSDPQDARQSQNHVDSNGTKGVSKTRGATQSENNCAILVPNQKNCQSGQNKTSKTIKTHDMKSAANKARSLVSKQTDDDICTNSDSEPMSCSLLAGLTEAQGLALSTKTLPETNHHRDHCTISNFNCNKEGASKTALGVSQNKNRGAISNPDCGGAEGASKSRGVNQNMKNGAILKPLQKCHSEQNIDVNSDSDSDAMDYSLLVDLAEAQTLPLSTKTPPPKSLGTNGATAPESTATNNKTLASKQHSYVNTGVLTRESATVRNKTLSDQTLPLGQKKRNVQSSLEESSPTESSGENTASTTEVNILKNVKNSNVLFSTKPMKVGRSCEKVDAVGDRDKGSQMGSKQLEKTPHFSEKSSTNPAVPKMKTTRPNLAKQEQVHPKVVRSKDGLSTENLKQNGGLNNANISEGPRQNCIGVVSTSQTNSGNVIKEEGKDNLPVSKDSAVDQTTGVKNIQNPSKTTDAQTAVNGDANPSPSRPIPPSLKIWLDSSSNSKSKKQGDIGSMLFGMKAKEKVLPPVVSKGTKITGKSSHWRKNGFYGGGSNPNQSCPFYKKISGTDIAVDAFSYGVVERIQFYFLSHFHSDHYMGLNRKTWDRKVYCGKVTGNLVHQKLGISEELIVRLPMWEEVEVGDVKVTLLEANHCPGAVLFLFKLRFNRIILHTGDFRAHPDMEKYDALQGLKVETLYLDTTYLDPNYQFPLQCDVINTAVSIATDEISECPKTLFVVGTYLIGKERIFVAIANAIGSRVFVAADKFRTVECLNDQDLLQMVTKKPDGAKVHVVPMKALNIKDLKALLSKYPRFERIVGIKPTGWTHDSAQPDLSRIEPVVSGCVRIYGLPYSEHSSFEDLRRFVKFLQPNKIIPTVNVGRKETREKMRFYLDKWKQGKDIESSSL